MVASVLREFCDQNPDLQVIMVSRNQFKDLFLDIPSLQFKGVDFEKYKGVLGLRKIAHQLKNEFRPDYVADLHDVIRTKVLNRFFIRHGYKVFVIDKGKEEKDDLTNVWNLEKKPLKHTVERYAAVFRKMGFSIKLSYQFPENGFKKSGIGFAPFAQHKGKVLPPEKSFELAKILSKNETLYFFGGGEYESQMLAEWSQKLPNTINLAGKLSLDQELKKIAGLQLMISMDSANMHLASLVGTRCISVWGATHPFAGFLGYGQRIEDVVQITDLTCRPCSVFGDKDCFRGDYACLEELSVQKILEKVLHDEAFDLHSHI